MSPSPSSTSVLPWPSGQGWMAGSLQRNPSREERIGQSTPKAGGLRQGGDTRGKQIYSHPCLHHLTLGLTAQGSPCPLRLPRPAGSNPGLPLPSACPRPLPCPPLHCVNSILPPESGVTWAHSAPKAPAPTHGHTCPAPGPQTWRRVGWERPRCLGSQRGISQRENTYFP